MKPWAQISSMELGKDVAGLIWLRTPRTSKHSWEAIDTSLKAQTRRSQGFCVRKMASYLTGHTGGGGVDESF